MLALGRERGIDDLERVFSVQMRDEYFPVRLADMGANITYHLPNEDVLFFPRGVVTARRHPHPGGAYSYRFDNGRKTLVICTDIEHGETIHAPTVEFCKGADLLIHDAQYTPEELESHRGWGHSSYEQAIECARLAGVKRLILTHHDPDHDDDFLAEMEAKSQALFPNCVFARDRMAIEL
jgi:ribonuclease BN (tRNA processing enzyme)